MQMIRHAIGTEGECVIGCTDCGEVGHFQPGETHHCKAASSQGIVLQLNRVVEAVPDAVPAK